MSGTTDRARQIAALADQLQPLGAKSRGMPIEATEWNVVIDVLSKVLEIDLAQETDASTLADQRYARIDHQHLGQVSVTWLDADLQARTADGGGGIATRQVLADMQQKVDGLQTQVARLTALLQTQQSTTDRAASNDIDRTRQLQAVNDSVAGVQSLSTTVAQVAQSQQALQTNVSAVLDLRKSLNDPSGNPINVAGLSQQVTDLQTLRDSLTGVDGKPLRLRDLQLQVVDLSNRLPASAGGTLEERLATMSTDVQSKASADAQAKVDALRTDMTAANAALGTGLTAKLEGEISTGRDASTAASAAQVSAAEARLSANLATSVSAARTSLSADLQANIADTAARSAAGLNDQIAGVVDARLPGLRAQVQADVQTALTPVLQKGVSDGAAAFGARMGAVESGLATLDAGLPEQIQAAVQTSSTLLQSRIDGQVTAQTQAAQAALSATIEGSVRTAVTAGLAGVPAIATQAVNDGLKDLDARVASSVATTTQTIPSQVGAAVDAKLTQANIAGQIQTANAALAAQLRGEIAGSAATVQANSTAALNASVGSLRGELNNTLNARVPVTRIGAVPVSTFRVG